MLNKPRYLNIFFNLLLTDLFFFIFFLDGVSQGVFYRIADMPLPVKCHSIAFSLGSRGYVAGGQELLSPPWNVHKEFYQYDPVTDSWTGLPNLPRPITEGVVFTIGSKAYITTGRDTVEDVKVGNLYVWDTLTGIWETKGSIPQALIRTGAVGFSINNKGYISTGLDSAQTGLLNDLWEYDPTSETWTKKADFPGLPRYYASSFVMNGKAYITLGWTFSPSSNTNDLWEYDPILNFWSERNSFPGIERNGAIGFAVASKGYIFGGSNWNFTYWDQSVWEFDPDDNQWNELDIFPGTLRIYASSFVINDDSFFLPGWFFQPSPDSWIYHPQFLSVDKKNPELSIFPNPASDKLTVEFTENKDGILIQLFDIAGRMQRCAQVPPGQRIYLEDVSTMKPGVYFMKVSEGRKMTWTKKVIVNTWQ